MKAILNKDVMQGINALIDANPDIIEVQLDRHETQEFLSNVCQLVKEGTLSIRGGFWNSYIYRGVPIIVTNEVLLG